MDPVTEHELLTPYDIYLFKEGKHLKLSEKLGSHPAELDGQGGTYFAVWAPNAKQVSVIGDFNEWRPDSHRLNPRKDDSGIWEGFIPGPTRGSLYKYHVESGVHLGYSMDKGDPFALHWEIPSRTASIVWDLKHSWNDADWMRTRADKNSLTSPFAIYEMHLGSWKRIPEDNNRSLTYRETASDLPNYLEEMHFTHVESRVHLGYSMDKGDPFALHWEIPSRTASVVWDLRHSWNDAEWMRTRADRNSLTSPFAIYEMHLGSWKRVPEDNNRSLTYRAVSYTHLTLPTICSV